MRAFPLPLARARLGNPTVQYRRFKLKFKLRDLGDLAELAFAHSEALTAREAPSHLP